MNERIETYQHSPEDELALLNYMRAFYKYSMRNTLLIEAQYRGAYGVASYKEHQKNGYHVQKGQKAIRILAPNRQDMFIDEKNVKRPLKYATKIQKQKIKDQKLKVIKSDLRGYVPVPVFDITQTDCPLQTIRNSTQTAPKILNLTERSKLLQPFIKPSRLMPTKKKWAFQLV